jgi:hypothetical protein
MKKTLVTASILSAALLLAACGEITEKSVDSTTEQETAPAAPEQATEPVKEEAAPESPAEKTTEPPAEEAAQPDESSQYTMGQLNAIGKAESYLDFAAFSQKGLTEQLIFEGFPAEDAAFAVEHIKVDWMDQAAKKAKSYLDFSSFSKQGLIEQLKFEGFTNEQAAHGASAVGY